MNADDIEEIRDGYWGRPGSAHEIKIRKLFAHIVLQAEQIATLKEIVRLDRLEYIDPSLPDLGSAEDVVDKQLAQEYPEIFGGKE